MGERIEITDLRQGSRRIVAVDRERLVLGGAEGADIVLTGAADGASLLLQRVEHGYRIQPLRPGATVDVNGQELFCKDLSGGDVIEFGGHRLRWLGDSVGPAPTPPPAPRAERGPQRRQVSSAVTRARSSPTRGNHWLVAGPVVGVLVLLGVLILRSCSQSTWPRTPQHYVDLARQQHDNLQRELALQTLDFALREATGRTRDEALALQKEIQQALVHGRDVEQVLVARRALELVRSLEDRWLRTDPGSRPAARQLLREADEWARQHGDVCRRHPDGAPLLRTVDELRARHGPVAAMHEPDTGADVVFAARAALRFQQREYPVALARLDAFLARQGDAAVAAERAKIVAEGSAWLDERLKLIDGLLQRNDHGNARRELDSLRRSSILPEWADRLVPREARVPK